MRVGGYLHKRRKPKGLTKATTEIQEKENLISCIGNERKYEKRAVHRYSSPVKQEIWRSKRATYKMTREEVKTEIFRYVFIYYNRIRICTSNPGGLSPKKYRKEIESMKQQKKAA